MSDYRTIVGPDGETLAKVAPPKQTTGEYTLIPIEVLTRRDLTPGAKVVLGGVFYIQHRGDIKGDLPSAISTLCGLSPSKARGYIIELEMAGILKRHSHERQRPPTPTETPAS
jgi:hypothetical protein